LEDLCRDLQIDDADFVDKDDYLDALLPNCADVVPVLPGTMATNLSAAPRPLRIVFLDVDGVLHSLHGQDFFVEECMQSLFKITHGSGAQIVLSSTWRTRDDQVVLLNRQLRMKLRLRQRSCPS